MKFLSPQARQYQTIAQFEPSFSTSFSTSLVQQNPTFNHPFILFFFQKASPKFTKITFLLVPLNNGSKNNKRCVPSFWVKSVPLSNYTTLDMNVTHVVLDRNYWEIIHTKRIYYHIHTCWRQQKKLKSANIFDINNVFNSVSIKHKFLSFSSWIYKFNP